nr:hypothetical protein [uncultured Cohaesibacter sp.]
MTEQITKHYVTLDGVYLGGFAGAEPPDGAIEVALAPTSALQIWDFELGEWAEASSSSPTEADYEASIQSMLDTAATERRYSNGATMATYVNSTNATWAAEAQAFVQWRDAVWLYAYAQLDAVMAGEREQPTIEALIAELPAPDWPDAA